jgi:TolB protein
MCTLFANSFLTVNNPVNAKVYVDINSPSFKMIPIAICDLNNLLTGSPRQTYSGSTLSDGIRKDLSLTGIFNVLNKQSFLEDKDSVTAVTVEKIRFPDWTAIGADYLLKGNVVHNDREIIADIYLFDVTRGETIFIKKYRAASDKINAIARAIVIDIMLALINDAGDFNTKIAFVSKQGLKSDIYAVNYDGTGIQNVTRHQSIVMTPRWSPDGNWLAFTSFKRGHPEIYLRNVKSGAEKRIASFDGLNLCGAFSPDSRKLLLTLSKDGNEEIYVMEMDTLTIKRMTNSYSIDVSPSWAPDGKKIAFVSNRSGSPQIYTMDVYGDNVKRITYTGSYNSSPSWSPRGDRIVYEGLAPNGKYQIFSIDAEGNNPIQLTSDTANNESPSWSPSGRQIVYVSRKNSNSRIVIMNSNGTNPRLLYEQNNKLVMPAWSGRFK